LDQLKTTKDVRVYVDDNDNMFLSINISKNLLDDIQMNSDSS